MIVVLWETMNGQITGRWGDQGNGTFRNPVIAADYSDPAGIAQRTKEGERATVPVPQFFGHFESTFACFSRIEVSF